MLYTQQKYRNQNIIGKAFGSLTVVSLNETGDKGGNNWRCICECGKEIILPTYKLSSNLVKNCGCGSCKKSSHGMSKTKIYIKWKGMLQRCNNKKDKRYFDYGGRGIKVCEQWHVFGNFYEDMKNGYDDSLTIERINVNDNYEKSNCKWATNKEQQRNRRNNVLLTVHGQIANISSWAEISGTNYNTIVTRMRKGMSHEECVYGVNVSKHN